MSIVTTVMTNVIIRKADKDSVNITIEADTKIPHDTELMADLAKLGSCKPDEVKLSDIKTGTVIMMVANSPLSSSYSNRQYADIILRLTQELKLPAKNVRIEIAFGIIDTLDNLDAWYPKVPAPVQVEPVLKLVQPSQAGKLTANAS